jgi:pimeloyl-ACP methyl ester carboxylesterase
LVWTDGDAGDTMRSMQQTEQYREAERTLWQRYGLEPNERYLELTDPALRLRVVEVGSGRPVLFIPGTGGTGPYWAPLFRELSGVRCLAMDRPGWGLSSPIDYRSSEFGELAASTLVKALDALELDRVDIVGASIGGLWALHLAQRHPSRVGRVVLLGGMPHREIGVPRFIKLLSSPLGAIIVRIPMSPKMLRSQLQAIGHGPSVAAGQMDDFIAWRLAFSNHTSSMRHERAMVRAIRAGDGWRPGFTLEDRDLADVRQPVRMILGSADPTGTQELWERFIGHLPNGELVVVPDAGHQPWWDEPTEVGANVASFLDSA